MCGLEGAVVVFGREMLLAVGQRAARGGDREIEESMATVRQDFEYLFDPHYLHFF